MGNITGDPCESLDYVECHIAVLIWKITGPIFLVVGLCGNLLSFVVLSRKRMRVFTTSVYLRCLAIVDSLVLLFAVLRDTIYHHTNIDVGELSDTACKVFQWINYNVTALSGWILCAIAMDRLIAVKYPLWTKSHCTKRIAMAVVVTLTVTVVLLNSHYLMLTLRKHARAIYRDFFSDLKIQNFIGNFLIFFLFLLKT